MEAGDALYDAQRAVTGQFKRAAKNAGRSPSLGPGYDISESRPGLPGVNE